MLILLFCLLYTYNLISNAVHYVWNYYIGGRCTCSFEYKLSQKQYKYNHFDINLKKSKKVYYHWKNNWNLQQVRFYYTSRVSFVCFNYVNNPRVTVCLYLDGHKCSMFSWDPFISFFDGEISVTIKTVFLLIFRVDALM